MTGSSIFDLIAFVLHDDNEEEQHPLDKHYPHYCTTVGEIEGCGRRLWFEELMAANYAKYEDMFYPKLHDKLVDEFYEKNITCMNSEQYGRKDYLLTIRARYKARKYFIKLWKNKNIEFLCCGCYAKATQPKFKGKSILQDSVDALASWMSVIQYRMIVSQVFEEFSKRFGNITERNEGFIDDVYGAPRGEPNDDDPQLKDYIEWLKDDISEGTGIPREELFGEHRD